MKMKHFVIYAVHQIVYNQSISLKYELWVHR